MRIQVKYEHHVSYQYEFEPIEPYTIEQVLDLLNKSHAWITPNVKFQKHQVLDHDEYVQTVVNDESIIIAKIWIKSQSANTTWTKQ